MCFSWYFFPRNWLWQCHWQNKLQWCFEWLGMMSFPFLFHTLVVNRKLCWSIIYFFPSFFSYERKIQAGRIPFIDLATLLWFALPVAINPFAADKDPKKGNKTHFSLDNVVTQLFIKNCFINPIMSCAGMLTSRLSLCRWSFCICCGLLWCEAGGTRWRVSCTEEGCDYCNWGAASHHHHLDQHPGMVLSLDGKDLCNTTED